MPIKVLFFASLREHLGVSQVLLESDAALSINDVWQRSSGQSGFPDNILVAVNHTYVDRQTLIQPGDEVAFFPPVTGG